MALVYVAGPISDKDPMVFLDNCEAGIILAHSVAALGVAPFSPHALAIDQQDYVESKDLSEEDWLTVVMQGLAKSDAVLFSSGWEHSKRCRAEHAFAVRERIPIFYSLEMLRTWLEGE